MFHGICAQSALTYVHITFRVREAFPQGEDGPVKVRVISGKSHGVESPVRPLGGCWYFHVLFKEPGMIFQEIRKSTCITRCVQKLTLQL